jgi:hypothetical protein
MPEHSARDVPQNGAMPTRMLLAALLTVLAAALTAPAAGAVTTVVADPAARDVTALDGTLVWISGAAGSQTLMQHDAAGDRPVEGAPRSYSYRSIDLGRDRAGKLVLTYVRCSRASACAVRRDDLLGHRASFKGLEPARCALTTAPALWRTAAAYGLLCRKRRSGAFDAARSGLYVKVDGRPALRLSIPRAATQAGATSVTQVDLRGSRVAAVAADVYAFAFTETTSAAALQWARVATSEGDGDERVAGLALGTTSTLWTLTDSSYPDGNSARISRLANGCLTWQTLTDPSGPAAGDGYPATALTADGPALYLVVPGTGIVAHEFASQVLACT